MKLVKFINSERIDFAPKLIKDADKTYANPSKAVLMAHGFLPLVETECPNKAGYTYTPLFEKDSKKIIQKWTEHKIIVETTGDDDEPAE